MKQWKRVTEVEFIKVLAGLYRNEAYLPEVLVAARGLELPLNNITACEMMSFLKHMAHSPSWALCVEILGDYILGIGNEDIMYEYLEHIISRPIPATLDFHDGFTSDIKEDAMMRLRSLNTEKASEIMKKFMK